jgi:protocatechuate 3,4-dioxygenase beta subunit
MNNARRLFLRATSAAGALAFFWARRGFSHDRVNTPAQTAGPFYPIPEIEKQDFFDADLTRKSVDSAIAGGEIVAIQGKVITHSEEPIADTLVEVWQACATGRYNHPQDKNTQPLDPNFQYWGRMTTGENGEFRFKTILPGKYPGRTPHIHFRIVAKNRPKLITQLYFSQNEESNRKDKVYMALNVAQRDGVTTGLEKKPIDPMKPTGEAIQTGNFTIVLGSLRDLKSTPPM